MAATYPEPFFLEPTEKHENTLILLHGTSQDGPGFAEAFLNFPIPISDPPNPLQTVIKNLPQLLPSTRFVFPTGKKRWCTVLGRESHAWFDFESFSDRTLNEKMQIKGLAESSVYLGTLVDAEVALLLQQAPARSVAESDDEAETETYRKQDARNKIVVGGFSQGSAMACIALLAGKLGGYEGEQIGGFVGLSGWCPFRFQILEAISKSAEAFNDREDLFVPPNFVTTVYFVRELLGLKVMDEGEIIGVQKIQGFLGHGEKDLKMKVHWGREMGGLLGETICNVNFTAYEELEHWWNQEEIEDMLSFLKGIWRPREK